MVLRGAEESLVSWSGLRVFMGHREVKKCRVVRSSRFGGKGARILVEVGRVPGFVFRA